MEKSDCYLRPFLKKEVRLYKNWIEDPLVVGPHLSVENISLETLLKDFQKNRWQNNEISRWLLCRKDREGYEKLLGFGHAWQFDRYETHMEFGRIILPPYRSKGIGTPLLKLLIDQVFRQFPETLRLQAITGCSNIACLRTWEKARIQIEGKLRKFMTLKEEQVDCYIGSILRKEWKRDDETK